MSNFQPTVKALGCFWLSIYTFIFCCPKGSSKVQSQLAESDFLALSPYYRPRLALRISNWMYQNTWHSTRQNISPKNLFLGSHLYILFSMLSPPFVSVAVFFCPPKITVLPLAGLLHLGCQSHSQRRDCEQGLSELSQALCLLFQNRISQYSEIRWVHNSATWILTSDK